LGEVYFELGRVRRARAAYRRAAALNPHDRGVRGQLVLLDALLAGRHRRAALVEVERLMAAGELSAQALPVLVDSTVALRVRWLAPVTLVSVFGYAGLTFANVQDGSLRQASWPWGVIGGLAVAALLASWVGPLLARLTPATRRLLRGLPRRDPLLALEVGLQLVAIAAVLVVAALWVAGQSSAVTAVVVAAVALVLLGGAVVAGLSLGTGAGGKASLLGLVLLPPLTLPIALLVAVVAAGIRLVVRAVRR
jgi:hypothetical protein